MKKIVALCATVLLAAGMVFAADPAEGLWKSIDDKTNEVTAVWEIYQEGEVLNGKIVAVANHPQNEIASACKENYKGYPANGPVNKMHTVGTTWIWGMKSDGKPGFWSKGHIINPGDGKMYGCVIKFMPAGSDKKAPVDTLGMAGTVGPIKVFQYWVRATDADIADLQAKFPAK